MTRPCEKQACIPTFGKGNWPGSGKSACRGDQRASASYGGLFHFATANVDAAGLNAVERLAARDAAVIKLANGAALPMMGRDRNEPRPAPTSLAVDTPDRNCKTATLTCCFAA
jgi:hypothetical protein